MSDQRLPQGLIAIPPPARSKSTTMKTVMADLASQLLAEMASFARSLQELTSIETPKVPRQNIQRPLARYSGSSRPSSADPNQPPPSMNHSQRSEHRMSMPAHVLDNPGSRSSTPSGRPNSPASEPKSCPPSPPSRPVDRPRPMSRDRASMQGFGSNSLTERERNKGRARRHIVIGSLYLLAGRWPDAVRELVEGATVAKVNSDHVWHGKALDYMLIVCLLYAWAGLDFRVRTQAGKSWSPEPSVRVSPS